MQTSWVLNVFFSKLFFKFKSYNRESQRERERKKIYIDVDTKILTKRQRGKGRKNAFFSEPSAFGNHFLIP